MSAKVRRLVRGEEWTPALTERREAAERALVGACRELALVARRQLGRPFIDPYSRDEPAGVPASVDI